MTQTKVRPVMSNVKMIQLTLVVTFPQLKQPSFANVRMTTDGTRHHHVVAALDQTTTRTIQHVLRYTPPVDNKYDALKATLIVCFEPTEPERTSMFFERFLRQLSSTVNMALAAFEDYDDIDTLVNRADRIVATRCQVETAPDIGKRQRQILAAATCVGSRRRMLFPGGHQSKGQFF